MAEDKFTVDEALDQLVTGLTEKNAVKVGGLWDFVRDIWSQGFERPELFDAWHVGLICLSPDTLVRANKKADNVRGNAAKLIPIKTVSEGDLVLTHRNRYRKVQKVFKRTISEEIVKLNLIGVEEPILITGNHRVLTEDGWKKSEELQEGEILVQVKLAHNGIKIKKIEKIFYEGYVHNLEVEEDNTYTGVKGIVFHNCEDVERSLEEGKNYVAVLPRFHFKSTILGHATSVWLLLKNPRDTNVLYLSYSDGMAQYHIAEINKIVRRVPQLRDWLKDRSPKADFSFRYKKSHNNVEILHGGLFSFKRGLHVNGGLIADDILRDPENPLNLTQLSKIDDHFMTESMFIPNQDAPVIVLGTPMMPDDLLFQLQKDARFNSRVLPALDPTPDKKVLFPELYSLDWLHTQRNARPKSFASEFMLQPYLSTESYFSDDDIKSVEDESLLNRNPRQKFEFDSELTVAGFDVGKKRHPSHLAIYTSKQGKIEQVCNYFLDNWEYTDQIELMNDVVENFGIDYGYFDNTRGELEERGLDEVWSPLHFGRKIKFTMAQVMEEYINTQKMLMIVDARQRSQITCVDGNLKAPETPQGHGDAFFSNAMAVMAHFELSTSDTETIGDMQDMTMNLDIVDAPKDDVAQAMEKITAFEDLTSLTVGACPECKEAGGWINANQLCLICNKKF